MNDKSQVKSLDLFLTSWRRGLKEEHLFAGGPGRLEREGIPQESHYHPQRIRLSGYLGAD